VQQAVFLWLVPALAGALVAWLGVRSSVAALVLWAEPLMLFGLLYALGWLLWERKLLPALGLSLGGLTGGAILRVPPEVIPPVEHAGTWAEALRGCTKLPDPVRQPIRVLTWTLGDTDPVLTEIQEQNVDLAILVGLNAPRLAEAWARQLRGEAMILPETPNAERMALVVRGAFQYCGGHNDVWEVPLPTEQGERARAVLTFPEVQGAGVVPFVAVQLPQLGDLPTWSGWSERVVRSSEAIGALSRTLGPSRVVVAGDFGTPRTFREVASPLLGAGLHEVDVPASWPAPIVGLHALDRVWTGSAWRPLAAWRLAAHGQSRAPLLVDLAPANAQAR
jgi:hypothetical protein